MTVLARFRRRPHTVDEGHLVIDRTACTGKGVCVHLLDGALERDEWGYPIVVDPAPGQPPLERGTARVAVALCPAGALQWVTNGSVTR